MRAQLHSWFNTMFRRAQLEDDLREELRFHLESRIEDLIRGGLPRAEATRRARIEFGGVEGYKERCREARGAWLVDELLRTTRDAWRAARRSPAFAAIAILSLALGIGANVAVFGFLRQLILSPLPVRDPRTLQQVGLAATTRDFYTISYPKFEMLRDQIPIFTALFGWGGGGVGNLTAGDRTMSARWAMVTGAYFDGLGVGASIGRVITTADDRSGGGAAVAVISDRLWQRLFDRDPAALGRAVTVNQVMLRVIGVLAPEFAGTEPADPVELYAPVHAFEATRPGLTKASGMMWMHVMGRLKPGVPLDQAQRRMHDDWSRIDAATRGDRGDNTRPEFMFLADGSHGFSNVRLEFSRSVAILMGLVALVFLIACANLTSLLFVRATRRAGEMSIRIALGASRAQLMRQWLGECVLLAVAGGVAGLLAARWITDLLLYFVPEANRASLRFQSSPIILFFTAVLVAIAGLLVGWWPAWRAARVDPQEALRGHGPSVARRRGRTAQIVLAVQLAASLMLVVGALLFARTLWKLNARQTGFERKTVVWAFAPLRRPPATATQEQAVRQMRAVIDTLRRSPHFTSVTLGGPPAMTGSTGSWAWAKVPGYAFAPDEDNMISFYSVWPDYFRTLGIPIVAGRDFTQADLPSKVLEEPGIIINERMARHYFAGRDPIGQKVGWGVHKPVPVIGVVRDILEGSLRSGSRDLVYVPMSLNAFGMLVARVAPGFDPRAAEDEIHAAYAAISKSLPVETGTLERTVQESLRRDNLIAQLSAVFGVLGVFLASIGLFGAVAHWTSGRTREIGIRMALGATSWDIVRLILQQSLVVTGAGILIGIPLSILGATLLDPLLFGVKSTDLAALAGAAILLAITGVAAAALPARKATTLDPVQALRYE